MMVYMVKEFVVELKALVKERFPRVRAMVMVSRMARDMALMKLGSKAAKARLTYTVICICNDEPRFPSGDELEVASILAERQSDEELDVMMGLAVGTVIGRRVDPSEVVGKPLIHPDELLKKVRQRA